MWQICIFFGIGKCLYKFASIHIYGKENLMSVILRFHPKFATTDTFNKLQAYFCIEVWLIVTLPHNAAIPIVANDNISVTLLAKYHVVEDLAYIGIILFEYLITSFNINKIGITYIVITPKCKNIIVANIWFSAYTKCILYYIQQFTIFAIQPNVIITVAIL